jgi:hypothetical protein
VLRYVHDRLWGEAFHFGQGQPRRPHEAGVDEILGRTALGLPELLPPDLLELEPTCPLIRGSYDMQGAAWVTSGRTAAGRGIPANRRS